MSANNDEAWLPVADACRAAGVPVRTGYRWVKSCRIPSLEVAGATKVRVSDLQRVSMCRQAIEGLPAQPARNTHSAGTWHERAGGQSSGPPETPAEPPKAADRHDSLPRHQPLFEIIECSSEELEDGDSLGLDEPARRARPPAVSQAREQLELLRLESQRERLVEDLDAARVSRQQAARRAADDAAIATRERALRIQEVEIATEHRLLALQREEEEIAAERQRRVEAAARQAELRSWREGVLRAVVGAAERLGGKEAIAVAVEHANRALATADDSWSREHLGTSVFAAVNAALAPFEERARRSEQEQRRADVVRAQLEAATPWVVTPGAKRPSWAPESSDAELWRVARNAAIQSDLTDGVTVGAAVSAAIRSVVDSLRREEERRAEARAWAEERGRVEQTVDRILPPDVIPVFRAKAAALLHAYLDAPPPDARPESIRRDAARVLAPILAEIEEDGRWRKHALEVFDLVRSVVPRDTPPVLFRRAEELVRSLVEQRTGAAADFPRLLSQALAPVVAEVAVYRRWAEMRGRTRTLASEALPADSTLPEREALHLAFMNVVEGPPPQGVAVADLEAVARKMALDRHLASQRKAAVDVALGALSWGTPQAMLDRCRAAAGAAVEKSSALTIAGLRDAARLAVERATRAH